MIPIFQFPCRDGQINIGWSSWDEGRKTEVSIKYAYPDSRGRVSRGSPEIALDVFLTMREFFLEKEESIQSILNIGKAAPPYSEADVSTLTRDQLAKENVELRRALLEMQRIQMQFQWLSLKTAYNALGERYDQVKKQLANLAT